MAKKWKRSEYRCTTISAGCDEDFAKKLEGYLNSMAVAGFSLFTVRRMQEDPFELLVIMERKGEI